MSELPQAMMALRSIINEFNSASRPSNEVGVDLMCDAKGSYYLRIMLEHALTPVEKKALPREYQGVTLKYKVAKPESLKPGRDC